jgi:hypothetical protein
MWVRNLIFFSLDSWCTPNRYRPEHRKADKQASICDEHVHWIGHGHGCCVRERALSTLKMMIFSLMAVPVMYSSSTIHNSTTRHVHHLGVEQCLYFRHYIRGPYPA